MRCQRCGFEIEPGQTFCSMCGTEQAKAIRADKKKKINSIFGIIKITSTNHLKMWGVFALTVVLMLYTILGLKDNSAQFAYICLEILLIGYVFFQCMIPYKNPNASKSKKYKLGVKVSFLLVIALTILVIFSEPYSLMDLVKR